MIQFVEECDIAANCETRRARDVRRGRGRAGETAGRESRGGLNMGGGETRDGEGREVEGARQLIRRGGMHVGWQRRRFASLGPEARAEGLIFSLETLPLPPHWFPIIEMPSP